MARECSPGPDAAATIRLFDGALHTSGNVISVHNNPAFNVARRTTDGLNQSLLTAQESFLIGVEDCHQAHLWQVQAFAQQVNAHEHIIYTKS